MTKINKFKNESQSILSSLLQLTIKLPIELQKDPTISRSLPPHLDFKDSTLTPPPPPLLVIIIDVLVDVDDLVVALLALLVLIALLLNGYGEVPEPKN